MEKIYLGGGCFWCVEAAFSNFKNVRCTPGYMGGDVEYPKYEQVCSGSTGHHEVCEIENFKSLNKVLEVFWRIINPFDGSGQFHDRGEHYQTVIFYTSEQQKKKVVQSKNQVEEHFDRRVETLILPAKVFYPAELYHHQFFKKNPEYYQRYFEASGRKGFIEDLWEK